MGLQYIRILYSNTEIIYCMGECNILPLHKEHGEKYSNWLQHSNLSLDENGYLLGHHHCRAYSTIKKTISLSTIETHCTGKYEWQHCRDKLTLYNLESDQSCIDLHLVVSESALALSI